MLLLLCHGQHNIHTHTGIHIQDVQLLLRLA